MYITAINEFDLNEYTLDIFGQAYESIFVDTIFGAGGNKKSELGQFFTPHNVKQ